MYSYVTAELPQLLRDAVPGQADTERQGIFGHSMGGHGALVLALRNPHLYASVSAFAPVCAPIRAPWGEKAFSNYLGEDRESWQAYDASKLVREHPFADGREILVDQGTEDEFLDEQLYPHVLEEACEASGQKPTLSATRATITATILSPPSWRILSSHARPSARPDPKPPLVGL